jgi:hypothetical protein
VDDLDALDALAEAADVLDVAARRAWHAELDLRDAVHDARRAGEPWSAIGAVLGITRQSAQQRFGRRRIDLDEEPPPRTATPPAHNPPKKPRSKRR